MRTWLALALLASVVSCTPAPSDGSGRPPVAPVAVEEGPPLARALAAPAGSDIPRNDVPAPADSAAPAAPAAAPYDLAADLDRLEKEALKDLGPRTSVARLRRTYLVVGSRATVQSSLDFIENVLDAFYNGRFDRTVDQALPVYLFGDAGSYEAYCKKQYNSPCISIYGFFSYADHRLVMNVGLGIGTLSHELVHPIVAVDFPAAPTWINEGIASLFEAPLMPKKGVIHGARNWRHPRLMAGLQRPAEQAHTTLPVLFSLSDNAFRDDKEDLHYAMARYFCQWLDGQGKLWPFYRAWRDSRGADPTGEKSFKEVTGKTVAESQEAWARWVRGL
jgi:hypothetical protein